MINRLSAYGCLVLTAALTASLPAQEERPPAEGIRVPFGGARTTGNPTPGTSQPEPPNLADRITLVGCVQKAPATSGGEQFDPNTPTDSRFVLVNAERRNVVPTGTGGSALTKTVSSRTFRLEAIESQLSMFVGTKVEISGQIKPEPPASSPDAATTGSPTLQVEFVQKIAATCF
jgi:hypothetical protein